MEFRLIYNGRLPAASQNDTRNQDKHRIRRYLHPQLKELWRTHPTLTTMGQGVMFVEEDDLGETAGIIEKLPDRYARCGYRFLPLIGQYFGLCCSLDILFLRRDQPGNLIRSGGDIDNRIKVLFDALKVPETCDQVDGLPQDDENPFYCLLEDDRLITDFRVNTDRLLMPSGETEGQNDVRIVMHVKTLMVVGHVAGQIV